MKQRLSFYLENELYVEVRKLAIDMQVSMTKLFTDLVIELLKKQKPHV